MCLRYVGLVEENTYPADVSFEDHSSYQVSCLKPRKHRNSCIILELLVLPNIFHYN